MNFSAVGIKEIRKNASPAQATGAPCHSIVKF